MLYDPKWSEPKVDAVGEHLLEAADYMQEHGWCTQEFEAADGRVCMLGALNRFAQGSAWEPAYMRLSEYLGQYAETWNDSVCRSQEEAIAALRTAARTRG